MKLLIFHALAFFLLVLNQNVPIAAQQQFASLGDFRLESGELIRDCRIGYRTFGRLNADKSNAVLLPTWAGGTTEQLESGIGEGKQFDTAKYYFIAVDALGNGVSSSPSNSKLQPRMNFPKFTIRDMVNTQHHLLTKTLGINHLKAIVGTSMGGMQAFQWIVSYPDFADKAIPIVGSPQLAPYDLLHWQMQLDAIFRDPAWNNGNYEKNPARTAEAAFGALLLTTPENVNRTKTRRQIFEMLEKAEIANEGSDANNKIRQTQAMMALDVSDKFAGSLERAAAVVKAKTLVIAAKYDHIVTPEPSINFARLLKANVILLENDCGHLAANCEAERVKQAVHDFLAQ